MNHLEYVDMILEQDDKLGRWATVKDIKVGTESPPTQSGSTGLKFYRVHAETIGKRILFYPYDDDPKSLYWASNPIHGIWYHKDWLNFDTDEEQLNLFTPDPKPMKIHWHSAGRE
jgi:hypothetical protein